MSQLVLVGLEPMILWLGVRRANHSAITTQIYDGARRPVPFEGFGFPP